MDQRITEILAQGWNGVEIVVTPLIGGIPIFKFSLIVLFVIGAIYWFGFKRRHVIANGEVGFDPVAN